MSHCTVLVVTDAYPSHDLLTATLQPWHTYESTGIKDHYVTFVPATAAEIAAYADHQATYQTIAAYFQDYHGYERRGFRTLSESKDGSGYGLHRSCFRNCFRTVSELSVSRSNTA